MKLYLYEKSANSVAELKGDFILKWLNSYEIKEFFKEEGFVEIWTGGSLFSRPITSRAELIREIIKVACWYSQG